METLHKGGLGQHLKTLAQRWTKQADKLPIIFEDGDPVGAPRTVPLEIAIPVSLLPLAEISSAFTINTIAFCADSMPGRGSKGLKNTQSNYAPRLAMNDYRWRCVA